MEKFHFGIRLNLGGNIGSGHLVRCIALAKEFRKEKKKVIFFVTNKKEFVKHTTEKFPCMELKGNTEKEFVKQCLTKDVGVFIIDMGSKNKFYTKQLQNRKTVILDDIGNKDIMSTILINGSIVNSFHKYKTDQKNTKLFLGSKYMTLRKEFVKIRKTYKIKKDSIKKILLTFGGSDDLNLTLKLIPYFLNEKYKITIVIGSSYNHKSKLEKIIHSHSNIKIKYSVKNMANLFAKQDLVITSSGVTIYELACIGVPCVIFPASKIQNIAAKTMTRNGFGKNMGLKKENYSNIIQIIKKMNFHKRRSMHMNGRKIIDGKGLERNKKNILNLLN